MAEKDLIRQYTDKLNSDILPGIDFGKLDRSCNSQDAGYAAEILKRLHEAFVEVYGTNTLACDEGHEFVCVPAVVQARKTGRLTLALLDLDLESSGEHWETCFFSPMGLMEQGSKTASEKEMNYIRENYIPYDYWYTPKIYGDIHVNLRSTPEAVAYLLNEARDRQQGQGFMDMK